MKPKRFFISPVVADTRSIVHPPVTRFQIGIVQTAEEISFLLLQIQSRLYRTGIVIDTNEIDLSFLERFSVFFRYLQIHTPFPVSLKLVFGEGTLRHRIDLIPVPIHRLESPDGILRITAVGIDRCKSEDVANLIIRIDLMTQFTALTETSVILQAQFTITFEASSTFEGIAYAGRKEFRSVFNQIVSMLQSQNNIARLAKCRTYAEAIDLIEKL